MSNTIVSGKPLQGIRVSDHKFQGVSTLDQLEDYGLTRPTVVESLTQRDVKHDEYLRGAKDLRGVIQRTFDKARRTRAEVYARYIEQVEVDNDIVGGTPAITLFVRTEGVAVEDGALIVPYSATMIAIDGETQTEARYLLRERRPETGRMPIAVTVYYGISEDHAKQILHDYNVYPHPVKEKLLASVNTTGPLSRAIFAACDKAGIEIGQLNRRGDMSNKKTIASYSQVMSAITGFAMKDAALKSNATKWFMEMNEPTSDKVIGPNAIDAASVFLRKAVNGSDIGKGSPLVWQCAGIKVANGKKATNIDWDGGLTAFNETKTAGQGGARMKTPDRIAQIINAM